MKKLLTHLAVTLTLLTIGLTAIGQTSNLNNVNIKGNLKYSGGNPATNKIAVSTDANGNMVWSYFSVFQDSINTGVYDTLAVNYILVDSLVLLDTTVVSGSLVTAERNSGQGWKPVPCFATCDTIQYILDSLENSPWTYNGASPTDIVQRDTSKNVGIGTNSPTAKLHVLGAFGSKLIIGGNSSLPSGYYEKASILEKVSLSPNTGNMVYGQVGLWENNDETNYEAGIQIEGVDFAGLEYLKFRSGIWEWNANFSGIRILAPLGVNFGAPITVSQGDIYITDIGSGVIMKSPDGTCYRGTFANGGTWDIQAITCP